MNYILRPYQANAVDAGVSYLKNNKKSSGGLILIPTGGGKSLCIANTIKERGVPSLTLQPSKEILKQNFEKYTSYGFEASIYSASLGKKQISNTVFATIGSVVNNPEYFQHIEDVYIDEAHLFNPKKGMYAQFLQSLNKPKLLGFTATPYRLSTDGFGGSQLKFLTRTRPRVFDQLVHYTQNIELVKNNWWTPLKYYTIPGFDSNMLKPNSTGADYKKDSIKLYYEQINFPASLYRVAASLLKVRKNILIFTRFVEEARILAAQIPEIALLTADTPAKERDRIIADFYSGKIRGIVNVGIMTTGIDFPGLETVLIARPTMSLSLWYQMIGRGVRPFESKENCWIIDMGDNYRLFGQVETLTIEDEGNNKWIISNLINGKKTQLTNKYYARD